MKVYEYPRGIIGYSLSLLVAASLLFGSLCVIGVSAGQWGALVLGVASVLFVREIVMLTRKPFRIVLTDNDMLFAQSMTGIRSLEVADIRRIRFTILPAGLVIETDEQSLRLPAIPLRWSFGYTDLVESLHATNPNIQVAHQKLPFIGK